MIEAHKRTNETRERPVGLQRAERRFINTSLQEDPLKLLEVGGGQLFIPLNLEHGDVVLVRLEKHPRLAPERIDVGADRDAWDRDLDCGARSIFEIGINE